MTDTQDTPTLEIKRTFSATTNAVFNAWTNREEWQAWIGPTGMQCEIPLLEPFVDGRFHIKMKLSQENIIPVIGVFRELEKPNRIQFTWGRADDPSRQTVITIMLNEVDGKTQLTLHHDGLNSVESRNDHERGWNDALNKLARHLHE